jgi:hypothetical protein
MQPPHTNSIVTCIHTIDYRCFLLRNCQTGPENSIAAIVIIFLGVVVAQLSRVQQLSPAAIMEAILPMMFKHLSHNIRYPIDPLVDYFLW